MGAISLLRRGPEPVSRPKASGICNSRDELAASSSTVSSIGSSSAVAMGFNLAIWRSSALIDSCTKLWVTSTRTGNPGRMVMVGWTFLSPSPNLVVASRRAGTHQPADIGKVVSTQSQIRPLQTARRGMRQPLL